MPSLRFDSKNGNLQYEDHENILHTILDFSDKYGNLSSIPLHKIDGDKAIIPSIFVDAISEYDTLAQEWKNTIDKPSLALILGLLVKKSMERHRPLSILEIGCEHCILSYFLGKLAKVFHADSKVYCVTNAFYSEAWLDLIPHHESDFECVNYMVTNQELTAFQDDFFDFAIINGSEFITNPDNVIQNAVRVTQKGGTLICLTQNQYLLDSCFQIYIDGYERYDLGGAGCILAKKIDHSDKAAIQSHLIKNKIAAYKNEILTYCKEIDDSIGDLELCSPYELENAITWLSKCEKLALLIFEDYEDIELKNKLNFLKECLLNYLYAKDETHKRSICQEYKSSIDSLLGELMTNI